MPCKNFTRHFFTIYILIDYYLNKKTISVREKFDNTLPSPLHIPGGLFFDYKLQRVNLLPNKLS